ncbi:6469_t:CDS:2, partial [Diversispora eburnea]
MLPQLPAEIIAEIFEYFQYDIKSIYSCVKVNRMWCKIAIPVLWRFPTQHKFLLSNNKFWSSISRIIISCLSDDSFKHIIRLYESNNLPFLQNELYRNFLSYGSRLKYLQLPYNIRLTKYPEAQYTLMNLQYLRCDANTSANYYNELAIYCCTLKKLIIDIWGKDNEGLANFIKSQHSLQHFEIHSQIIQIYPLIADALCTQVDTLKYLRIVGNPCFKSSVIGRFQKLKTLSLENFNHHVEVLENLKFPELENLDIIYDTVTSFEVYKEIIEGAAP